MLELLAPLDSLHECSQQPVTLHTHGRRGVVHLFMCTFSLASYVLRRLRRPLLSALGTCRLAAHRQHVYARLPDIRCDTAVAAACWTLRRAAMTPHERLDEFQDTRHISRTSQPVSSCVLQTNPKTSLWLLKSYGASGCGCVRRCRME